MNEAGNSPPQPPVPAGPSEGPPPETDEPGAPPGHDPRAAAGPPPSARDLINDHAPPGGGNSGPSDSEPEFGGGNGGSGGGRTNPLRNPAGPNTARPASDSAADGGGAGKGSPKGLAGKAGGSGSKAGGAGNRLPSMPEGGTPKERAGHRAGQAARRAARKHPVGQALSRLADTKMGNAALRKGLNKTPLGRMLPKSFKNGLLGDGGRKGKEGGKGKDTADASGSGTGSGGGRFKVAIVAGGIPLALLLLLPMAMGAAGFSDDDDKPTQPDDKSNAAAAKYFPGKWQQMLEQAADRAASGGEPDYATVPWTVLAGIVATQTDFARYSPYDNVDRDPGRTAPQITPGGGSGGPDDTSVGITSGAGPGPIQGVSGSGESTSASPDHPGPPAGDLSHQLGWFMWAMRMHESSGDYNAGSRDAACGAYQYMPSTWNHYEGKWDTACDAPPSIQDQRARNDFLASWKKFHMWQGVAIKHFTGSDDWATSPGKWGACPAACDVNPTGWGYVDDVMNKMQEISKKYPATAGQQPATFHTGPDATTVRPADMGPHAATVAAAPSAASSASNVATAAAADLKAVTATAGRYAPTGAADRAGTGEGVLADGCAVGNPSPSIGGKDAQGVGPYLLTPDMAGAMRHEHLDPQNPCDSSYFVAQKLSYWAQQVHGDPSSPPWVPNGSAQDQENARKYWSKVIEASGMFMDRASKPAEPCAVPPPDDPKKPWSINFKIISIWHCEVARMPELYLVTGGQSVNGKFTYTVEEDRSAAEQTLINEAVAVSYAASNWKTDKCDDKSNDRQGIFPMTPEEAAKAGVADRCDVEKNIEGAAKLVLAGEGVPPEKRDKAKGDFQPMAGGWQALSIAMGKDLGIFSLVGPSTSLDASEACTKVMTAFLNKLAPLATEFAALKSPPDEKDLDTWRQKLSTLETTNKIADPAIDPACMVGSWSPGFSGELADLATSLAGGNAADADALTGLGDYYQAADRAVKPTDPVVGQDPLVIPRLAPRPYNDINAPAAEDATEAWSITGTSDGSMLPVSQVAIDYAWFFGGVIPPFDSAGKLIGSLANGSAGNAPPPPGGVPGGGPPTLGNLSGTLGERIVAWASKWIGLPYQFGGGDIHGPTVGDNSNGSGKPGFDCSGLTLYAVYNATGGQVTLAHYVPTQWENSHVQRVSYSDLQPGDLIAMHDWGHVGIYIGGGKMIHAPHTGDVVKISDITQGWYRDVFVTGGRVTQ
ncbi:C40 family peptidase [Actinoallomurus sp. NPDC050550]|uniref:C40 family peptidase n=1 Tax=Actinoallomurus sp. NPDC050550 TaxID=3154937 RepID=UPI0033C7D1D4